MIRNLYIAGAHIGEVFGVLAVSAEGAICGQPSILCSCLDFSRSFVATSLSLETSN